MNRHVWVFGDADAYIYREDENGDLVDFDAFSNPLPVIQYCFLQGASLSCRNPGVQRRAITGRGRRKIVPVSKFFDEVNISIEHLLFRKSEEFNILQVFTPLQQLRISLKFTDITYIDVIPFENDSFELSFARSTSFSITGRDAENVTATAEFEAEILI